MIRLEKAISMFEISKQFNKNLNCNKHQTIEIDSVVVTSGVFRGVKSISGYLQYVQQSLEKICCQKTMVIFSQHHRDAFQVKKNDVVAVKLTLRKLKKWMFLQKLFFYFFANIKYKKRFDDTSFDSNANYSFGIESMNNFLDTDKKQKIIPFGCNVNIVFRSNVFFSGEKKKQYVEKCRRIRSEYLKKIFYPFFSF